MATLYAANEVLFPTSVLDVAGPIGKAVGKAGKLIKAGGSAEEAASAAIKDIKTTVYVPNVGAIGNMKDFLKSPGFGSELGEASNKTSQIFQGQSIYKATDTVGEIRKGDQFYLDGSHKDHIEVFGSMEVFSKC